MSPKELPTKVAEQMLLNGAVVLFGPDYLENSLLLLKEMKEALAGKAVLSGERIDDLAVPSGPMLNCLMVFFHRMPDHMTWGPWKDALMKGLILRSFPPKGLGVADKTPEDPRAKFVPGGGVMDMQLIVTWLRPLESSHVVETARAIERSYLENGGRYDSPGVFKRLRSFFP